MSDGETSVIPATKTAVRVIECTKYIEDIGVITVYGIEIYCVTDQPFIEKSLTAVHDITSVKEKAQAMARIIERNCVSAIHLYDVVEDMLD